VDLRLRSCTETSCRPRALQNDEKPVHVTGRDANDADLILAGKM